MTPDLLEFAKFCVWFACAALLGTVIIGGIWTSFCLIATVFIRKWFK